MLSLIIAFCALGSAPQSLPDLEPIAASAPLPVQSDKVPFAVPKGWNREEQDGATVLTPADVAQGKFYAVMVTMLPDKAASLDSLLGDAKKLASEIGTFKPLIDAKESRSEGGWDYIFVLGLIKSADREVMSHLMGMKKGDKRGVLIVLSDSSETMEVYADTLSEMIRGMGGTKSVATKTSSGVVDLQFAVPAGWVQQKVNGFPLLVKEKNEQWVKYRFSLLIFPTETLGADIRQQFEGYWNDFVAPNYETKIAPIPLMTRLKSGNACAFDAEYEAKDKSGNQVCVAIYMIAHGERVVPVMGIYSGETWTSDRTAEAEIAHFLDSARIPSASAKKVTLFPGDKLAGEWSEASTSFANYVTRSGEYAGDATISTAAYFTLGADHTYSRTLMAIGNGRTIREKDAGKWSVEDDELVLSKGGRYSLFGYGAISKVGRFMVIGKYSNQKSRLKFTNPRGLFQAQWLRAK